MYEMSLIRSFRGGLKAFGRGAIGAVALALGAGCGGAGAGSAGIEVGATTSALTSDGAAPVVSDHGGATFALSVARVHLRDIRLKLPAGVKCAEIEADLAGASCAAGDDASHGGSGGSGEDEIRIAGPFVVDLLTRSASPDLSSVKLPALGYRRIDLRIDDAGKGDVGGGDPLVDHSFQIEATRTSGGGSDKVVMLLDFNEDLRIESPSGVKVEDGAALLVGFDAGAWLGASDLGACIDSGDAKGSGGVVRIDRDTKGGGACGDLEGQIKDGIKASSHLDHGGSDDGAGHG